MTPHEFTPVKPTRTPENTERYVGEVPMQPLPPDDLIQSEQDLDHIEATTKTRIASLEQRLAFLHKAAAVMEARAQVNAVQYGNYQEDSRDLAQGGASPSVSLQRRGMNAHMSVLADGVQREVLRARCNLLEQELNELEATLEKISETRAYHFYTKNGQSNYSSLNRYEKPDTI